MLDTTGGRLDRPNSAFAHALHAAIYASGLTLEALRRQLEQGGVSVSLATLSYWQHGRSQPERASSLRAVELLEQALSLAPGALSSLLTPTRGRRRRRGPDGRPITEFAPGNRWLETVLDELDAPAPDQVSRLASHDRYRLDAERGGAELSMRFVLRANIPQVSRFLLMYAVDLDIEDQPTVAATRYARLGRQRYDPDSGLLVLEILLERDLAAEDTALLECDLQLATHGPADHFERHFTTAIGQYLLEVAFDPAAQPVRCFRYTGPMDLRHVPATRHEIWLGGTSHAVHTFAQDVGPETCGAVGIEWTWN
jgi:hypothetical protein